MAFLACLFRHGEAPAPARDHAVVFESAATLRTLAGSPSPFIPIVYGEDTERELASHYRQRHCIVVRPRNAVDGEPDVAVELLGSEAFEQALADMGVTDRDRIDRLASESGRSPTVLRRRLSPIPAIRTPWWLRDPRAAVRPRERAVPAAPRRRRGGGCGGPRGAASHTVHQRQAAVARRGPSRLRRGRSRPVSGAARSGPQGGESRPAGAPAARLPRLVRQPRANRCPVGAGAPRLEPAALPPRGEHSRGALGNGD